jgi:hypothetical protein
MIHWSVGLIEEFPLPFLWQILERYLMEFGSATHGRNEKLYKILVWNPDMIMNLGVP